MWSIYSLLVSDFVFSLSFQSDFSTSDKTSLVKSISDTDAKLLGVLPKGVR